MSRRSALCVLACLRACFCLWAPGCGTVSPAGLEANGRGEEARPAAAGGSEVPPAADGESARSRPVAVREKAKRGIVTIQVADRSLDDVLSYLSRMANVSLVAMDDTIREEKISLDLKDVNWRVALGAVARRCGLSINEARIADGVILISRAPKGAKPAPAAKPIPTLPERPRHGAAPGRVYVNVVDRPMKAVLDYLSRRGRHKLIAVDDSIRDIKVTLQVEHLDWRVALDVIAEKYFLAARESEEEERTLLLERR